MVVTAVVVTALVVVVTALVTAVIPAIAILIVRNVYLVVPAILNKIDTLAAGIIFTAMFTPVFCMAWRYVQIDWGSWRYPHNQPRLSIEKPGLRGVANVDAPIKVWLPYADGNINIGSKCRGGGSGQRYCD